MTNRLHLSPKPRHGHEQERNRWTCGRARGTEINGADMRGLPSHGGNRGSNPLGDATLSGHPSDFKRLQVQPQSRLLGRRSAGACA